jgi:nucleoside-diphosphate-sugar epimerase
LENVNQTACNSQRISNPFVTRANGYIASNIVDLLLQLRYNVRGTVRAEKPWLNAFFEKKYGKDRFETSVVPNLEEEGAFDEALKDIAGVIHAVSNYASLATLRN